MSLLRAGYESEGIFYVGDLARNSGVTAGVPGYLPHRIFQSRG
jgi:hypothetical protein